MENCISHSKLCRWMLTLATALLMVALCATRANADTIYTTLASFNSAVGGTPSFQSFEGLAPSNSFNTNLISVPGFTVGTGTSNFLGVHNVNVLSSFATDGTNYVRWFAQSGGGTVTFTFSQPIIAFSVTLTDAMDGGSNPVMNLVTNGGSSFPGVLTGLRPNGQIVFLGLVASNPFTTLSLTNLNTVNDGIGLDEVRWVQFVPPPSPVPEPSSMLLLGTGAIGLFLRRRRRAL